MKKPILSIVILNYNTPQLVLDCLESLSNVSNEMTFEVIVVDNGSTDNSTTIIRKFKPGGFRFKLESLPSNLGFGKGNNQAKVLVEGKYILILNSDTLMHKDTLIRSLDFMEQYKKVGILTCKMVLPDGTLDKDARRSFPTPWISLTHLILRIDRLFPKSKIFSKYWYGYIDPDTTHEIDVAQGAYMFARKKVLDEVGWFDEDYFLDGEDIDLCWRIKLNGWKIVYYPEVSITHIKKASKKNKRNYSSQQTKRFVSSGMDSMELFYRKNWWERYPIILNYFVLLGIRSTKSLRLLSHKLKN